LHRDIREEIKGVFNMGNKLELLEDKIIFFKENNFSMAEWRKELVRELLPEIVEILKKQQLEIKMLTEKIADIQDKK
tara:strand:+ start:87 stop:317 length:231 start_codon:yes stop_codon:yes gene_type:complete